MAQKEILVCFQITGIRRKTEDSPAKIELTLAYKPHMINTQRQAEEMIEKLYEQELQRGKIRIKGLSLVWNEDD